MRGQPALFDDLYVTITEVGESAGTLDAATLVWRTGMESWTAAAHLPEVQTVLSSIPPALPPQA